MFPCPFLLFSVINKNRTEPSIKTLISAAGSSLAITQHLYEKFSGICYKFQSISLAFLKWVIFYFRDFIFTAAAIVRQNIPQKLLVKS